MSKLSLTVTVVLVTSLLVGYTDAVCRVCNSNGAACINKSEFYLCFNNTPETSVIYTCPMEDQLCTAIGPLCVSPVEQPSAKPACGDTSKCGQCEAVLDGGYTCTSRNTFTMCFDGMLSEILGECPPGELCYSSLGSKGGLPCAAQCVDNANELCDLDAPTTVAPPSTVSGSTLVSDTTTTIFAPTPPMSTVPPPTNNENAVCASQNAVGRFPYPNDTACKTYVNCSTSSGGVWVGKRALCPEGRYFNSVTHNCQLQKPSGCI